MTKASTSEPLIADNRKALFDYHIIETFEVGVHGPIQSHFRLDAERSLPLPVDYIVAATGG